jgi:hypothetical protein
MRKPNVVVVVLGLVFAVALSASAATNLLKNGDFEAANVNPWTTYGNAKIELDTAAHSGKGAGKVTVGAVGANFWDSGLQYTGVEFKANTQYTWAAFVKAAQPRRINMKPELAQDPWTGYGEKQQDMTADWKEIYVEFLPPAAVKPASLTWHIAESTATFWVDDARWYEGKYEPLQPPAAVSPKAKLAVRWADMKTR